MKKNYLKNLSRKAFILLSVITIGLCSCKKENVASRQIETSDHTKNDQISIKNGRLRLTNIAFTRLMNESHEKESVEVINAVVRSIKGHSNFISLKQEINNYNATGKISEISIGNHIKGAVLYPQDPGVPIEPGCGYCVPVDPIRPILALDSLVEDPYFASVLNPEGEVQVDSNLYKVTEYGTFVLPPADKAEVDSLVANLDNGLIDLSTVLIPANEELESLFRIRNKPRIRLFDTYGKGGGTPPAPPVVSTIVDFPVGENVFANVAYFDFNDAKTWAGKLLQGVFGRDHYNDFRTVSKRRMKVNFYSKNWLIFASVGVTSRLQKKVFIGWGAVENMDEMRLGWSNMIIKLNVPQIEDPTNPAPVDFWNTATKVLTSRINFNFNQDQKNYLVYRVSDIIEFDKYKHVLPFDLQNALNKLIAKTNNSKLDGSKLLESQLDKLAIERLAKIVQTFVEDKTKKIAFTTAPRGTGIDQILIPTDWEYKYSNQKWGEMDKTFDWATAIVGASYNPTTGQTNGIFKAAKTIQVMNAEVMGLGKLNGEWVGVGVVKK